jgi:hypothetical protein
MSKLKMFATHVLFMSARIGSAHTPRVRNERDADDFMSVPWHALHGELEANPTITQA